jgi:putative FmdB family regulatory protein
MGLIAKLVEPMDSGNPPALAIMAIRPKGSTMPIYEYICDDCKTQFEKLVFNKQQEISCPKCSSKKATIQLSVFATHNGGSSTSSFSGGGASGGGGCCGGSCGCH